MCRVEARSCCDRAQQVVGGDFQAALFRDLLNVHPVFGGDFALRERPRPNGDWQDDHPAFPQFCVDSMGTAQPLDDELVIHSDQTLPFVAPVRNMICSAATCDSRRVKDESLEAQGLRLREARVAKGFDNAAAFAKVMKIHPTTYRAYEAGQNGFSKLAYQFAEKLDVPVKWLLEGGEDQRRRVMEVADEYAADQTAKELGLALVPQLELGYSMGGGSIFTDYRHTGVVPFQREWLRGFMRGSYADLFVARGEGDSMQPTMLDGDIVLIDTAQKDIHQQDRIWALSYGELGMIKRVRRLPGGTYRILSDNPSVEPFDAADGEMYVVGRVVWIGRRM